MGNELKPDKALLISTAAACPVAADNGFTLLEVLIAMLLLMVGMLAWMQLQLAAIQVNEASKKLMMAQDRVSQEFEQIKTIGYAKISDHTILTNSSFGYSDLLSGVPASNQLTGIDTSCNAPATYCVYKGLKVDKSVNGNPASYYYTVKLAVNPGYLQYPEIAQIIATVYWKSGSTLKNMQIASFVGM